MKYLLLLLLFTYVSLSGKIVSSRFYFDRLDVSKGLSQSTVYTMIQDNKGFMWFATKDGLNRYDGRFFKVFKHDAVRNAGLGSSYIMCLVEDTEHNIWVGTDIGLYIYYPEKELFESVPLYSEDGDLIIKSIQILECDNEGRIWIVVDGSGIYCYDPQTKEISCANSNRDHFKILQTDKNGVIWLVKYSGGLFYSEDRLKTIKVFLPPEDKLLKDDVISCICFSDYNRLYVGFEKNGVAEVNLLTSQVKKLNLSDKPIFARNLLRYSDEELWLASESGIYIYNLKTQKCEHLQSRVYDPYSLSDNAIYSLYKDREGGLWIGSFFGGINYLPQRKANFDKYYYSHADKGLKGRRVREICKGNDGLLWVGTEDAGLYTFNPKTEEFSFFPPSKGFSNVHGLCMDGDNLWVSTFSNGVQVINTRTWKIKGYMAEDRLNGLNSNYVFALCKTKSGQMYVGTMDGLQYYDRDSDRFKIVPEITGGKMINDIKEDSDGNLWVTTFSYGVYRFDARKKAWSHYLRNNEPDGLPTNKTLSIFEDTNKQIWLTTEGFGFCKFNPKTETFINYSSIEGMPSNVIFQMVEDSKGYFWMTTNQGLVKFDPKKEQVSKVYTVDNGLLSNQFNYKSSYKSEEGIIYFGCTDGLVSFLPENLSKNDYLPPVYITDFSFMNKKNEIRDENYPLKKSIFFLDSLRLKHNQNSFSLQLAALSYQASHMNRILYKLEGFDTEWRLYSPDVATITYSNINYGKYLFKVKASNNDGVWNEEEKHLHIEILPPFYLSNIAYFIYVLLLIGLISAVIIYLIKKNERKQRRYIQEFEREKERELYDSKISFFTNVVHEIRTPLTLIKGPLENILNKRKIGPDIAEDLNIMKQNTGRLLDLTSQLLDFQKTEKERFSFNFVKYNISDLLDEVFLHFTSLARQQDRVFELEIGNKDFYAFVDKEALTKILSNLLNNALKYSEKYIHVSLDTDSAKDEKLFRIKVTNDGDVVPPEMREKIFKPFFRYTREGDSGIPGTGIGLALARSLTEFHNGNLVMEASEAFNVFVLTLPIVQNDAQIQQLNTTEEEGEAEPDYNENIDGGACTILVVEDNKEMCLFIKKQLADSYSALTARNGIEALKILNKEYISLIISDIMMPGMDGFELCKRVKEDLNFSHIPIILLTAKTNLQSKIDGLEVGADAYIEKPFSSEYLLAVTTNLINGRKKLREVFTNYPLVTVNSVALTKTDTDFLAKLQEIIHANLGNPEFKMEDIAKTMNMSRANFYRKIKGKLDLTPNDYLRIERLKVAAKLLKDNKYQVSEVCYMVGFNSSSYFSKCFKKQFGVLPTEFVEELM